MKLHWYWIVFSCLVTAAISIGSTYYCVYLQAQSNVGLAQGCEVENRVVSQALNLDAPVNTSDPLSSSGVDNTWGKTDALPKVSNEIDPVDEKAAFANIADDERVAMLTKKIHSDLSAGVKHYQDTISKDYDSEQQDIYWSSEYAGFLSSLLKQHNALAQLNQYDLECKTTLCKISFASSSPQEDRMYMQAISAALTRQAEPVIFYTLPSSDGGDNVVYARITRD